MNPQRHHAQAPARLESLVFRMNVRPGPGGTPRGPDRDHPRLWPSWTDFTVDAINLDAFDADGHLLPEPDPEDAPALDPVVDDAFDDGEAPSQFLGLLLDGIGRRPDPEDDDQGDADGDQADADADVTEGGAR